MAAGGTRQPVLDVVPSRRNRAPLSLLATFRTRIPDRNLWVVYATTWVLATAYGLALATTPLVLHERVDRRVVLVKGRGADLVLPAQMQG